MFKAIKATDFEEEHIALMTRRVQNIFKRGTISRKRNQVHKTLEKVNPEL